MAGFPNQLCVSVLSVRENGWFPEPTFCFGTFRSGKWLVSRTNFLFWHFPFGKMAGFPNQLSVSVLSVRENGWFPEPTLCFGTFRSGKWLVSRTNFCFGAFRSGKPVGVICREKVSSKNERDKSHSLIILPVYILQYTGHLYTLKHTLFFHQAQ